MAVDIALNQRHGKVYAEVRTVSRSGWVDWPLLCDDGRVLYDFPGRVSRKDKIKARGLCEKLCQGQRVFESKEQARQALDGLPLEEL